MGMGDEDMRKGDGDMGKGDIGGRGTWERGILGMGEGT